MNVKFLVGCSPLFPFLETSQPQWSSSPRLQFLVRVYMTPAELIAWTKDVSLVAVSEILLNIHELTLKHRKSR